MRALEIGSTSMNDAILVRLRVDRRDDALPESVVEHIVDSRRRDAEAAAVARSTMRSSARPCACMIAGDIGESRQCRRLVDKRGVQVCNSSRFGVLEDESDIARG